MSRNQYHAPTLEGQEKRRLYRLRKQKSRRARTKAYVDGLKNKPCMDCGGIFPAVCMDFDHVHGDKVHDVALMRNRTSFAALEAEIAKCELVCANCHRIRTERRRAENRASK